MIKKIIIHYGYGCWGHPTKINSDHASFTLKEVKFTRKPEMSCKSNCRIEYKYDPNVMNFDDYKNNKVDDSYLEDFMDLCRAAESLIGRTSHERICDAIGSSIEIIYNDGNKKEFSLFVEGGDPAIMQIYNIANKYAPDFFKED